MKHLKSIRLIIATIFVAFMFGANAQTVNIEEHKIMLEDKESGDFMGTAVSIYEDFAVSSAPGDDDHFTSSGSVIIYKKNEDGEWELHQKLHSPNMSAVDDWGQTTSLYKDILVIGHYQDDNNNTIENGAVYIYNYIEKDDKWVFKQKIIAPSKPINYDFFGMSARIYGNYIAVGGTDKSTDGLGAIYIYEYNTILDKWIFHQKIKSPDGSQLNVNTSDNSNPLSLCEDYLAIAGFGGSNGGADYVCVYTKTCNDPCFQLLQKIDEQQDGEDFGRGVAINNKYLVIGANSHQPNPIAYAYSRDESGKWINYKILKPKTALTTDEYFSSTMSIFENLVLMGACRENWVDGAAYLFDLSPESAVKYELIRIEPKFPSYQGYFGGALCIDKGQCIIGAFSDGMNLIPPGIYGAAYIYDYEIEENKELYQISIENNDRNSNPNDISISPNPVSDIITLSLNEEENQPIDISIYSTNGELLKSLKGVANVNNQIEINLNDLNSGMYFVKVKSKTQAYTKKFIKL